MQRVCVTLLCCVQQALLRLSEFGSGGAVVEGKLRHKHSVWGTKVLCVVLMAAVWRADHNTAHAAQDANTLAHQLGACALLACRDLLPLR